MSLERDDRRHAPRVPLTLSASLVGYSVPVVLHTADVSERGACIVSVEAPPVGASLVVELGFPGLVPTERLSGTVRWVKPGSSFGIEWEDAVQGDVLRRALADAEDVKLVDGAGTRAVYRVLVADDNHYARATLKRSLIHHAGVEKKICVEIIETGDGRAAWERLQQGSIDLMVLERYLPVLDGLLLMDKVRSTPAMQTMPIIMCSTGKTDTRVMAASHGADFYVAKPFRLMDIFETVCRFLRATDDPRRLA